MKENLHRMSAGQLLDVFRSRQASPVEAIQEILAAIERLDEKLNAFILTDAPQALQAARESESRWQRGEPIGPLDGVPISVKDIILTKGWPTLRGSRTVDPHQSWGEDAPAVARLREAGAVIFGKTMTPEFGWKGVTDSPLTGVTRNPWKLDRTPGGSSGGSAAAVASGLGPLSIGTDGGGSIRIPAAFSGIFGLKPTFGRVPAYPLSPFGTIAHLGPMARSAADAARLLNVISLPDARDWHALPPDGYDYFEELSQDIRGLRMAFSPTLRGLPVDPEVAAAIARAAKAFEEMGALVEEAEPPLPDCAPIFRYHWYAGAATVVGMLTPAQQQMLDPGLREIAAEGQRYELMDYLSMVKAREAVGSAMNDFHRTYDLLLLPSLPIAAFGAGREVPEGSGMSRWPDWTPFSYPFNLSRQPAASVPCGLTADGMPIGLQIVGPLYADHLVLAAAHAYEQLQPYRWPPLAA